MIKDFHDLEVYKLSKELFVRVNTLASQLPKRADYLSNQVLRAANSIHANIAEGFGRSEAEFKNYLTRALGSANEVTSHLEDIETAGFEDAQVLRGQYTVLGKRIYTLRERWKRSK